MYLMLHGQQWPRTIRTAAYSWAGTSIAIRMMGAKSLWNHDAYFDYIDRYMAITKGTLIHLVIRFQAKNLALDQGA